MQFEMTVSQIVDKIRQGYSLKIRSPFQTFNTVCFIELNQQSGMFESTLNNYSRNITEEQVRAEITANAKYIYFDLDEDLVLIDAPEPKNELLELAYNLCKIQAGFLWFILHGLFSQQLLYYGYQIGVSNGFILGIINFLFVYRGVFCYFYLLFLGLGKPVFILPGFFFF